MPYLIYRATTPSGGVYIGKTVKTLWERRKAHYKEARSSKKAHKFFMRALRKYGDNVKWEIIEKCDSEDAMNAAEIAHISDARLNALLTATACYNHASGGQGGVHDEITRRRISAANKGRKLTSEQMAKQKAAIRGRSPAAKAALSAKLSAARKGKPGKKHTAESKRKISIGNIGKVMSAESRAKMSLSAKGKIISKETRVKLSVAGKGLKRSQKTREKMSQPKSLEYRANMSISQKGRIITAATRAKLRAANLGKKHSQDSLTKMSARHKGHKSNTPEVCAKISAALTGKKRAPFSAEWRAKLSAAGKGRKQSPEHVAKRTAARRKSTKPKNAAQHSIF